MENLEIKINDELKLKLLQLQDADAVFNLVQENREPLRKWLPWVDGTQAVEDSAEFIESSQEKFKAGKGPELGIWYQDKLVGLIGLNNLSKADRSTHIGYWLDKNFYGKGIATQSVAALIKYVFEDLKFHRIVILCATENTKSKAIPERLGLKAEGVAREAEWLYDHFVDIQIYSILEQEYPVGVLKDINP